MVILDAIEDLPQVSLGSWAAPNTPYITESYSSPTEFVYISVAVVERFSTALHVFESATGLMIASVSVDGGAELLSLNLSLLPSANEVVFQANLDSVIPRRESPDGIATFSTADNRLRIPSLELNSNGSISNVSNVVFVLSDPAQYLFTLESYDQ